MPSHGIIISSSQFLRTISLIPFSSFPRMIKTGFPPEERFFNSKSGVENNYTHTKKEMSLLQVADYIVDKEPILTSQGVMFKHQDEVVNLLMETVQSFLDTRKVFKKKINRSIH